nr:hypothetical protein [Tanacetum cinerariifolium]
MFISLFIIAAFAAELQSAKLFYPHHGGGDQGTLLSRSRRLEAPKFYGTKYESCIFAIHRPDEQKTPSKVTATSPNSGKPPLLPPPIESTNTNTTPRAIKWISLEERQEHLNKGLCFNCDSKWMCGHKCPGKFLFHMAEEDDNPSREIPADPAYYLKDKVNFKGDGNVTTEDKGEDEPRGKWMRGHKCPGKFLFHMAEEDDNPSREIHADPAYFLEDKVNSEGEGNVTTEDKGEDEPRGYRLPLLGTRIL